MRALQLIQHMRTNADRMSEGAIQKTRSSEKCTYLPLRVPVEEQQRYSLDIYRDLTDWLAGEADPSIQQRYVALGMRRARQKCSA